MIFDNNPMSNKKDFRTRQTLSVVSPALLGMIVHSDKDWEKDEKGKMSVQSKVLQRLTPPVSPSVDRR